MSILRPLDNLDVDGKRVLVRADLNVPMHHGRIEDTTRIERLLPTLRHLLDHNAKVILISHFGRPKGEFDRDLSLAPLADALSHILEDKEVRFAIDCIGKEAEDAVNALAPGEVLLLENLRFHPGEKANDPHFASALAALGDCYVNDTFSCSHRAHASIVGLAEALPSAAGFLLQQEVENLQNVLQDAEKPLAAIVGGAKVSTKLAVLENLVEKVDALVIGGAMANTFLLAQGLPIGNSLHEPDLVRKAQEILDKASVGGCQILLPNDVVTARALEPQTECTICYVSDVASDSMILDIGPETVGRIRETLSTCKTVIWNGPMGAFEVSPFDVGTISIARAVASLTQQGKLVSVGGGGDVVSALGSAGLTSSFTYISTAGGAFLEWLEGKELPGIAVLR